jgi:chromosome segregation ATPase
VKESLEPQVKKLIKKVEELSGEVEEKERLNEELDATLKRVKDDLIKIKGKSNEEIEVSRIRVQAILTSASLEAERILGDSKVRSEEILRGAISRKEELEREVSELKEKIAELKKKKEEFEYEYERKVKIVERRLSEIREAWAQMARAAEAKGMVWPSLGI